MRAKRPVLAKLSRPALHRAVPRERLFALLDSHRHERKAICVVGPPGAGKTTLAGSWLDTRGIPGIWYQVDTGDADLSTFFYYLALAAEPYKRRGQRALQLLRPEYLSDVAGFARRFFRDLFARLPTGSVVAFDNYQEVPAEEPFHHIVALAVDEAPPGIALVVISRRDPPTCYARLVANENVALVDWDLLRLDPAEADAIARRHGPASPDLPQRLHDATDGWAAGLVLALEGGARKVDPAAIADSTRDATFNYFAAEIFSRVPTETQRFLMWTALLPDVPVSLAERLTGELRAGAILDDLFHRHFFTHRKPGAEPTYWYHALFRSFLALQARQRLDPDQLTEARLRAAALLEERDPDAALAMYCDAQDWDAAERLIVRDALALIGQGRWKVVVERTCRLPQTRIERSAWLSCWLGVALTATEPAGARRHLERSFSLAAERADATCQACAASGVIQTYLLEYNQFRPLDRWVEAVLDAIPEARFPSADAEVMAHSSVVTAFGFRQLSRPELERSALRLFELLPSLADVNLRLSAAMSILAWGSLTGPIDVAHRSAPIVESLWRHPDVTALNAAVAGHLISWYFCSIRDRPRCVEALRVLVEIQERDALPAAGAYAATIGAILETFDGNTEAATRWLELLDRTADTTRPFDRAMLDNLKGWLHMVRGEGPACLAGSLRAVETMDELGSAFHQIAMRPNLVWHGIEFGAPDQARRYIAECRAFMAQFGAFRYEVDMRIAEATLALHAGDRAACEERLGSALVLSREQGLEHAWMELRRWMPALCAVAFEAGIEPDYVRRLIRHYGWQVPPERPQAWPWPVRVHAFGPLRVFVHDEPLMFSRKTPRKPIALLKAILAFGERDVPVSRLMDALWPDAEGDNAYHSFGLALHRLRKLLRSADAVVLDQSKISLNPDLVWTDAGQFDADAARAADRGDLAALLRMYPGHFLADSDEQPWAIAARERYRKRFVEVVSDVARRVEAAGQPGSACDWYRRALEIDPLAEEFAQGLMRCHIALGDRHQAEAVFKALKARLSTLGRVAPSGRTLSLARSLSLDIGA